VKGREWSKQEIVFLIDNWGAMSATKIGAELGRGRNAIIGKAHRLGLPDATPQKKSRKSEPVRKSKKRARAPKKVPVATAPPPRSESCVSLTLNDDYPKNPTDAATAVNALAPHHCKWPIGDPKSSEFGFCGERRADDGPYCARHEKKACQGESKLERDRRRLAWALAHPKHPASREIINALGAL